MRYSREEEKERAKEAKGKLVQLWLSCKSIDEFNVRQELEVPDARACDVRACKLHWISKMHPALWYGSWVGSFIISIVLCFALDAFSSSSLHVLLPLVAWFACLASHLLMHVDTMQKLEWHEAGCPIDYSYDEAG